MRCRVLATAVSVLAAVALAAGQAPPSAPAGQTPTFRAGVDAVTVDAIVTDRQGRPVLDLTQDDFEIIENKKPQAITSFKLVKIDDTALAGSSFVHDISSLDEQQRETAREDRRVLVIFLDDYHVRIGNSMVIRPELAKFVSELTPNDLVALMYPLTSVNALTFSRNHDETAAAIMRFQGRKYNYVPANAYEQNYAEYPPEAQELLRRQIVITALRGLATYLGTLRSGRKQVLYVSEGITGTLPPGIRTFGTTAGSMMPRLPVTQTERFFNQAEVMSELQLLFGAAARSNTSFYTIDPRGLAVTDSSLADHLTVEEDRELLNDAQDSLRILSANTDGRAIVNRNQPLPELRKMISDTSAYYLLGYTSSEAWRDGKFHEIQVRVKRRDVDVRHRKGYWALTAEDVARATAPPRPARSAAVEEALDTLAISRSHAVRTWVGSQRAPDGRALVTFAWEPIPAREGAARPDPSDAVDRVVLTATSAQGDELFRGPVPRDPQTPIPAGRVVFAAPPGPVKLTYVAQNARALRLDHDEASVDVPDFTSVGPMITTPAVYRGRTARDLQVVRSAESPLPSVSREFSRTERLLIRFQAYGPGGTTPRLAIRLLNNQGTSMATFPDPVRLPDGTFEVELGLGPLAPGQYVVEIGAEADGAKTQSLVAIRVTP